MARIVTVILKVEIPDTVLPDTVRQAIQTPFYASSLGILSLRLFEGTGKAHELQYFSDQGPI